MGMQIVNKAARAEYSISEKFEAGMLLMGPEVKSLRLGRANLKGSFVKIIGGEAFLHNMQIQAYPYARIEDYEPTRLRKLLLSKKELLKLVEWDKKKGVALVPLRVYFSGRLAKLELGVGKGKHEYEKREDLKKRDQERELRAQFKQAALR